MKAKTKKVLALILAVLMAVGCFALSSCSKDEYIDDGNGNRVKVQKIKFLHIWPEHSAQMTKIVNDFMAANRDVKIEIIQSNYSDVPSYLNAQVISGSVPDVFFYWTKQVTGYVKMDVALDLTPYIGGWKDTYLNDGEAWEWAKVGGKYYSAPFRMTGDVIAYNKTFFQDNGLSEPTSFEQFETLLAAIRATSNRDAFAPFALTGITSGTLIKMYTALQNFYEYTSEMYKDPNYTTGQLKMDDTGFDVQAKMVTKLRDWYLKGYFGQCDGKTDDTALRNFKEGNAAMVYINNNNLYLLDDIDDGFEVGFMSVPAPAGVDYTYINSDFDGFSVYKNTKNPDACIRFLKYLTSKEVGQNFADATSSIMTQKDITYAAGTQSTLAEIMKDAGNSLFAKPDVKYSASNMQEDNNNLILNFIMNKSSNTALDVVKGVYANYVDAITDAGLTMLDPTVTPASSDLSWLEIRK